jgi:hypothetical protein
MNEEKVPEPTPAKYRFTWRGVDFKWVWQGGSSHFTGESLSWNADVKPDGWTWEATLRFAGGTMTAIGATPQLALAAASQAWVNEVNRILGWAPDDMREPGTLRVNGGHASADPASGGWGP